MPDAVNRFPADAMFCQFGQPCRSKSDLGRGPGGGQGYGPCSGSLESSELGSMTMAMAMAMGTAMAMGMAMAKGMAMEGIGSV